jgi:YaiO family outer membrane protein
MKFWKGRAPSKGDAQKGDVHLFGKGERPLLKGRVHFGKGGCPLFVLLLAAPAAFACDAGLEAAVAARPDDLEVRESLARACQRAGRPEEALAAYDVLLAHDADNVDWLLGKGQALLALDRASESVPILDRGRTLAPAYEDVWRLQAAALEASGKFAWADELLSEAARAFPQSAWPAEKRRALAEERLLERGTRLTLDASYEDLSGGRDAWQGATVGIDRRLGDASHLLAGMHLEERFDRRDEQIFAGFADRLDEHWSYAVSVDGAPDAEVLPEWSLALEAGRALGGGRSLGLRVRHASHTAVDVDSLTATLEQYMELLRVSYSLNTAKTSGIDDPSFGHTLRLARDYGRDSHVTLALGYGEESETVAPGVVQVTDVRSVSLHGLHWRSAAWGVSWEIGWTEQGDLYDRTRVRLGLEHRF